MTTLSNFLKDTQNKWVKIDENDGFSIIQRVDNYNLVDNKGYFKCQGKSYSNCGGDVIELDEFYMTKQLLNGNVYSLNENDVENEIMRMKGEMSV